MARHDLIRHDTYGPAILGYTVGFSWEGKLVETRFNFVTGSCASSSIIAAFYLTTMSAPANNSSLVSRLLPCLRPAQPSPPANAGVSFHVIISVSCFYSSFLLEFVKKGARRAVEKAKRYRARNTLPNSETAQHKSVKFVPFGVYSLPALLPQIDNDALSQPNSVEPRTGKNSFVRLWGVFKSAGRISKSALQSASVSVLKLILLATERSQETEDV